MITFFKKNILFLTLLVFFSYLYITTLYPGIGGRVNYGDSVKWQYLWYVNGTPHSTGYPLFLLISKFFGQTLLFLDFDTRIKMISFVFAIGTLFVLYKISKLFIKNPYAQYLPIILLGGTTAFWSEATEPEVYTLNSFFVSLVIYFALKFYQNKQSKYYYALISMYALSFGNHLTMIFLLPALSYILFITDSKFIFKKKTILITAIIMFLGASQYLYLLYLSYFSSSLYLEYLGKDASISHWISYIIGSQFQEEVGGNNSFNAIYFRAIPAFISNIWSGFGLILIVLIVFIKRNKFNYQTYDSHIIIFLSLIGLFELLNALSYDIDDIVVYYIPVYLIISLLIAKIIDLFGSYAKQNLFVSIISIISFFIIMQRHEYMSINYNPYNFMKTYFQMLPPDTSLFVPTNYAGYEAIKYAELVDFKDKRIHYISHIINNDLNKTCFTNELYKSELKPLTLKKEKSLYHNVIDSTIHLKDIKTIYIPCSMKNRFPRNMFAVSPYVDASNLSQLVENYKNELIIISAKEDATRSLDDDTYEKLSKIGLNLKKLHFRGSYIAVLLHGKVVFEKIDNNHKIIANNKQLSKLGINKIVSAGHHSGSISHIIYNNQELSLNKRGLNIVIIKENAIIPLSVDTYKSVAFESPLYKAKKK